MRIKTNLAFLIFQLGALAGHGQGINTYFEMVRPVFDGEKAKETVAYVEQFWRLPGNSGFNKSIDKIIENLEATGYELEGKGDSRFTYRVEHYKLDEPAWEPEDASLSFAGSEETILSFKTNRNMIAINSFSTPPKGVEAEIIQIENNQIPGGVSAKGKILYSEGSAYRAFQIAKKSGAIGVITYSNPGYLQPEKNTTSIQFRNIPYDKQAKIWALCLSFEANEKLKGSLESGNNKVKVVVKTNFIEGDERMVVAEIKGSKLPEERFVLSAHVQEPGANDNASGVGTLVEMARVSTKLVRENQIDPKRTITFIWGNEIIGTSRFVNDDPERKKGIKWGMSLDMVGENTALTGGSFLIEKMPDPSAIWTRGDDHHTEWGAGEVKESDLFPHFLNDLAVTIFRAQGEYANWTVNYNPFEGGSDHVPFLRGGIPGILLWHFTDQFYHSDLDRIDKVSATEMKNVGVAAMVLVYLLTDAGPKNAEWIETVVMTSAMQRLDKEFALSKKAIEAGKNNQDEMKILNSWKDWYLNALESVKDIAIDKNVEEMAIMITSNRLQLKKYFDNKVSEL